MPQGRKPKLLIIDDEKDLCGVLTYRFRHQGVDVLAAHNEDEGFQKILDFKPDTVLLDVRLEQGHNGFSILRKLRYARDEDSQTQDYLRTLPVIVFSGNGSLLRELFESEGATAYIEKPYDPEVLRDLILKTLNESCGSGSPTKGEGTKPGSPEQ